MKRILLGIGMLLLASMLSLQAQIRIKVMSFNIAAGKLASLQELADVIKAEKPDIVGLQELDYKTNREIGIASNKRKDYLTELAYLTGMQGIFFPAIDYKGGKYGIGVLTSHSFNKTKGELLPHAAGEQRVVGYTRIDMASIGELSFLVTHLDMSSQENGLNQAKMIDQLFVTDNHPKILVGDMNARPGTAVIDEFTSKWTRCLGDEATTGNGAKFDYIFFYPQAKWRVVSSKVLTGVSKSDHYPIVATLEYLN